MCIMMSSLVFSGTDFACLDPDSRMWSFKISEDEQFARRLLFNIIKQAPILIFLLGFQRLQSRYRSRQRIRIKPGSNKLLPRFIIIDYIIFYSSSLSMTSKAWRLQSSYSCTYSLFNAFEILLSSFS
jgi:hypothetical protein